jgi:hypothetical protein
MVPGLRIFIFIELLRDTMQRATTSLDENKVLK